MCNKFINLQKHVDNSITKKNSRKYFVHETYLKAEFKADS